MTTRKRRLCAIALPILFLTSTLGALLNETKGQSFPTINITGERISSVFQGLRPSAHIRDVLVLRKSEPPTQAISTTQQFSKLFVDRLVSGPPVYFACPT
jgi:hypothetical protein